jgi:hypothetical protein
MAGAICRFVTDAHPCQYPVLSLVCIPIRENRRSHDGSLLTGPKWPATSCYWVCTGVDDGLRGPLQLVTDGISLAPYVQRQSKPVPDRRHAGGGRH